MTDATHRNGNIQWLIGLDFAVAIALAGGKFGHLLPHAPAL